MKILSITNGFSRMNDAGLELRANQILTAMTGNASFADPSPTLVELQSAITAYSTALVDCRDGDRLKIAVKNQKRQELISLLHLLGDFVLFKSAGDSVIAQSSGFSIGKMPAPLPPISKPGNLRVEQGNNSGELLSRIDRVKGAVSYLFQYATDEMMAQDNWQWITCSKVVCMFTDLQPGTKYNCRVAAVGRKSQMVYSDVVSRIVA